MKRIGLAVIGRALPEASALSSILQDVRRGLLATVVVGVLISAFILLLCFRLYQYLLAEGVSPHAALVIAASWTLLLAGIIGRIGE